MSSRTYRIYISGGMSERMRESINQLIPTIFNTPNSVYPFSTISSHQYYIGTDDPEAYKIEKILEMPNTIRGSDEAYFDVIFAGRPAGAASFSDDQWFWALADTLVGIIRTMDVEYEDITN